MAERANYTIVSLLLIAITTITVALTIGCRKPQPPAAGEADVEQTGEPEQYSATVICTTTDGATTETRLTRVARSGEKWREEWTEKDQKRALILRPDLGKSFLLDLDRRLYVELEITAHQMGASAQATGKRGAVSSAQSDGDSRLQAIDHYFDETQSPAQVETRMLPPVVIDSHRCRVYEQRTVFVDGHTEITRRYRADDLAGLPLRIDCESEGGGIRVTIERRDVRLQAGTESFVVPEDFQRIDRLR